LQRRFRAVPGVIDVTGWGGKTKTFELEVDFNKLLAYGLTLPQLLQSLVGTDQYLPHLQTLLRIQPELSAG